MSRPTALIAVADLRKTFRLRKVRHGFLGGLRAFFSTATEELRAVDGVSFEVQAGEIVGYLGPNGAGKSTTLKMLTGILRPTSGMVRVEGRDPHRQRQVVARRMGVIFGQRTQLIWELPALDTFELMRTLYAVPRESWRRNLEFLTESLAIRDLLQRPVRQLSLGQRMRCELVASLLHDPAILYLDEPTIGLDVDARERVREFILRLNREKGTTVILTSHDLDDIERLCRRVILIDRGRKLFDGALDDLKSRHAHERRLRCAFAGEAPTSDRLRSAFPDGAGWQLEPGNDGRSCTVRFDPRRVDASALTKYFVNHYEVTDLALSDTELESVVRTLYRREP